MIWILIFMFCLYFILSNVCFKCCFDMWYLLINKINCLNICDYHIFIIRSISEIVENRPKEIRRSRFMKMSSAGRFVIQQVTVEFLIVRFRRKISRNVGNPDARPSITNVFTIRAKSQMRTDTAASFQRTLRSPAAIPFLFSLSPIS